MSVEIQIEELPGYFAAKFTGACAAEEAWRRFETIAERCQRANKNKLLLDFTQCHGDISVADRYLFVKSARIFAQYKLIKTAYFARPDQVDSQKFGEMVAQNRWVNARIFTNVEEAEKWLLE
jgi:hypothetical protein